MWYFFTHFVYVSVSITMITVWNINNYSGFWKNGAGWYYWKLSLVRLGDRSSNLSPPPMKFLMSYAGFHCLL